METLTALREKTFLVPINPYDQRPSPVVHRPDARAFVKLYNRLSVAHRLSISDALRERIEKAKTPKVKRRSIRERAFVIEEETIVISR